MKWRHILWSVGFKPMAYKLRTSLYSSRLRILLFLFRFFCLFELFYGFLLFQAYQNPIIFLPFCLGNKFPSWWSTLKCRLNHQLYHKPPSLKIVFIYFWFFVKIQLLFIILILIFPSLSIETECLSNSFFIWLSIWSFHSLFIFTLQKLDSSNLHLSSQMIEYSET